MYYCECKRKVKTGEAGNGASVIVYGSEGRRLWEELVPVCLDGPLVVSNLCCICCLLQVPNFNMLSLCREHQRLADGRPRCCQEPIAVLY